MSNPYVIPLGKTVQRLARLRGGGSALPGLIAEKIDPDFVRRTLAQLPRGIVVISGTNGKTTTAKIAVALLESQGFKVFTNRTGSNFSRGVAAALLGEVDRQGRLAADIAVLELDEAHAVHFVKTIPPNYSLLLNVMRDQLDRFGEIDTTAGLLQAIANTTTDSVILNRDDPRLGSEPFVQSLSAKLASYGVDPSLLSQFPSDDELHGKPAPGAQTKLYADDTNLVHVDENAAVIAFDGHDYRVPLKVTGVYNMLNAAAAVALCRAVMKDELRTGKMLSALSTVEPAFGRGESLQVNGQALELLLVKNPAGFRLSLASFPPEGHATMIAVNDNYADGRDMSWLWDVEFDSFQADGVNTVSGVRAYDMALRLQYDEVAISHVEPNLRKALRRFIAGHPHTPKRIFCTYTAMLSIRRELSTITKVKAVS